MSVVSLVDMSHLFEQVCSTSALGHQSTVHDVGSFTMYGSARLYFMMSRLGIFGHRIKGKPCPSYIQGMAEVRAVRAGTYLW